MSLQVAIILLLFNINLNINIVDLVNHLVNLQQKSHHQSSTNGVSHHISRVDQMSNCNNLDKKHPGSWDVIALHVSPEMGERIMISGFKYIYI